VAQLRHIGRTSSLESGRVSRDKVKHLWSLDSITGQRFSSNIGKVAITSIDDSEKERVTSDQGHSSQVLLQSKDRPINPTNLLLI
jgi:hypothetical protein